MADDKTISAADDEPQLPQRLRHDIAQLAGGKLDIPRELDAAILARARADYARRLRWRPAIRWVSAAAAVAAAAALAIGIHLAVLHPVHPLPRQVVKGDLDGNGRVNMLDAFILAKRLAAGEKLDLSYDFNDDGVVDQKDVDWLAQAAVSLAPRAGGSGGGTR